MAQPHRAYWRRPKIVVYTERNGEMVKACQRCHGNGKVKAYIQYHLIDVCPECNGIGIILTDPLTNKP